MNKKKIFLMILVVATIVVLTTIAPVALAEEQETPHYDTTEKTIDITTAGELQWLSDYSNGQIAAIDEIPINFSGWTVNLKFDEVDLNNASWTPIADFHGNMVGVPQTSGKSFVTIKGLNVRVSTGAGLCGNISYNSGKPYFSNIEIANSTFVATGNYAGAFSGNGYTAQFDNCHATSVTIQGARFIGGIVGMTYGNITSCSVTGDTTINAPSFFSLLGDNVGGIVGLMGEGGMRVTSCLVQDAKITGDRQVGGIVGLANYGNSVIDCDAIGCRIESRNTRAVYENDPSCAGGIVGQINNKDGYTITVSDNSVGNCTIVCGQPEYAGWLVGEGSLKGQGLGTFTHENNVDLGGNYDEAGDPITTEIG